MLTDWPITGYFGGIQKITAVKIQKISEITATLPLTEFDSLQKYRYSFKSSELGRIHSLLYPEEMASDIFSWMLDAVQKTTW